MEGPVVLGIETATELCGVAVTDRDGLRAQALVNLGLSHSSKLMELVGRVTSDLSVRLADVDAVAVSLGPGSFTGIRIGMATALGLAAGAGTRLVGVPTLDAFAAGLAAFQGIVCPFVDARRGEVYFCFYESAGGRAERIGGYAVAPPLEMARRLGRELDCRDAARALVAGPLDLLSRSGVSLDPDRVLFAAPERRLPDPASVARLGFQLYLEGKVSEPESLRAIYVRRSDAEFRRGGKQ